MKLTTKKFDNNAICQFCNSQINELYETDLKLTNNKIVQTILCPNCKAILGFINQYSTIV